MLYYGKRAVTMHMVLLFIHDWLKCSIIYTIMFITYTIQGGCDSFPIQCAAAVGSINAIIFLIENYGANPRCKGKVSL